VPSVRFAGDVEVRGNAIRELRQWTASIANMNITRSSERPSKKPLRARSRPGHGVYSTCNATQPGRVAGLFFRRRRGAFSGTAPRFDGALIIRQRAQDFAVILIAGRDGGRLAQEPAPSRWPADSRRSRRTLRVPAGARRWTRPVHRARSIRHIEHAVQAAFAAYWIRGFEQAFARYRRVPAQ